MTRNILVTCLGSVALVHCGQFIGDSESIINNNPAEIARDAINEYRSGINKGDKYWRMMSHRDSVESDDIYSDSYIAWLQHRLIYDAISGKLFIKDTEHGNISLRITWDYADDKAWYICVAKGSNEAGHLDTVMPATLIWTNYDRGTRVTPNGPGDDLTSIEYPILGMSSADLLHLDVYRLPRDYATESNDIMPSEVIETNKAYLVMRIVLPIIIRSGSK